MPNWCSTRLTLIGERKDLKALYKIMRKLESYKKPAVPNGFGTTWLGCLVHALGGDWEKVYCRGDWSELELQADELSFNTMTAWEPCNEVMEFIREKFPSISYFYMAEESGLGYYVTNDAEGRFFPYRFKVSICDAESDCYEEDFTSLDDALAYIRKCTDSEVSTAEELEALNERLNELNEDAYCYLEEYKVVK